MRTAAEDRFFESTRGQVITLLRRGQLTVEELASALGLTDNAIRTHLLALERDGIVTRGEPRRGTGKPAFTYVLTNGAERLFPKAYGVLLRNLLQVLDERLPREAFTDALREVGHRVAAGHTASDESLEQRIETAIDVLGDLGGLAEAEQHEDGYLITGYSCPIAAAVEGTSHACELAETLLSDVIGTPVRQACITGPSPQCRFEVLAKATHETGPSPEPEGSPMR